MLVITHMSWAHLRQYVFAEDREEHVLVWRLHRSEKTLPHLTTLHWPSTKLPLWYFYLPTMDSSFFTVCLILKIKFGFKSGPVGHFFQAKEREHAIISPSYRAYIVTFSVINLWNICEINKCNFGFYVEWTHKLYMNC